MTKEGISVEELENFIVNEGKVPKVIYSIPFHHNPTGHCLSPKHSSRLIEIAKKYNIVIISDDAYPFLNYIPLQESAIPDDPSGVDWPLPHETGIWSDQNCACLVDEMDPDNPVISIGSFAKIIAPGLRLGWIYTTPKHLKVVKQEGIVNSGGGVNPICSQIVHQFILQGFLDNHLLKLRQIFSWRLQTLSETISAVLPPTFSHFRPSGGYFIWLTFPDGVIWNNEIAEYAKNNENLIVPPGTRCNADSAVFFTNAVRLSFAFHTAPEIVLGIQKLKKVLQQFYPAAFESQLK